MAEKHQPIPRRDPVSNSGGLLSDVWRRFLESIFNDVFTRIENLETTVEDHETRIDTLEGP